MLRKLLPVLFCLCAGPLSAQDSTAIEVHGFVTQGLIYSHHNNYLEAHSSDGDPDWSEAAISLTDQPTPKLRVGIQLHYFRLGDLGSQSPTIDWASGDYKVNRYFGVRAGKVKTVLGLFNDSQDVDAVYLWSLLPQSTYAIDNRSYYLAHLGGEVYGDVPLPERAGRLRYRAFAGANTLDTNGGISEILATALGTSFSNPLSGPVFGGDLNFRTPWKPLTVGTSLLAQHLTGKLNDGTIAVKGVIPVYYAKLERNRLFLAAEYRNQPAHVRYMTGPITIPIDDKQHQGYLMASYRATDKLQLGTYYSRALDLSADYHSAAHNSKDFVLSTRYDFNPNFYAKAEQHFIHGTLIGFYPDDNAGSPTPRTAATIAKVGFTF